MHIHYMKTAIKRQPIKDTVEAESTTTVTLPARLTRAPSPAPTMTWASCTMQVRAAQSMPVPRLSNAVSSPPNFLCSFTGKGHNIKKALWRTFLHFLLLKPYSTGLLHNSDLVCHYCSTFFTCVKWFYVENSQSQRL